MKGIESAFYGMVGKAAELKTSRAGKPYAAFSVGVDAGEDATGRAVMEWVRVTVFGDMATAIAPKLEKGVRVYAEGRLSLDRWTDKDGGARFGLSLAAFTVERVGAAAIGRNRQPRSVVAGPTPAATATSTSTSTPAKPARSAGWQAPVGGFEPAVGDTIDL